MTDKTVTISARIPVETAEELKKKLKKGGKTLRDVICEYAEKGGVGKNKPADGVNTVFDEETVQEILSMADFFNLTPRDLLNQVLNGLMEGTLTLVGGKIEGKPSLSLDDLEEACHDRGITVQEAINKTIKSLKGGK